MLWKFGISGGFMSKTLENIKDIFWIGDLSLQDADILAQYSRKSSSVIEFGVGGSTHIIAQCTAHNSINVETDPKWIAITKSHIDRIVDNPSKVTFCQYKEMDALIANKTFDLVFVDGIDDLREDFANKTWPLLSEHGVMIFHDTRRLADFKNVIHVAEANFLEVKNISFSPEYC